MTNENNGNYAVEIRYTARCSVDECKREFRATTAANVYSGTSVSYYYDYLAKDIARRGWTQLKRGVWQCERDHSKTDNARISRRHTNPARCRHFYWAQVNKDL